MNTTSRGGGCNAIFPTLKRGAIPNRESNPMCHRSNPSIYWWDKNAIIFPKNNPRFIGTGCFNGLKDKG